MTGINLLDLHDPMFDRKPYSWIEVSGNALQKIFDKLIGDICTRDNKSKRELSLMISKNLNCHFDNIGKRFYHTKGYDWYPIPLIITLVEMWSESKGRLAKERITNSINFKIEFIRCGRNSHTIFSVKKLTKELASLCGAIIADECLSRDVNCNEKIIIIDHYKLAIEKCSQWCEKVFGIPGRIRKSKYFDAWCLFINSKIITRFFNKFLLIPYGKKSNVVKEPELIKKSKYRLDFAKGVILMDGSVELDYVVSFGTTSKNLAEDVKEILKIHKYKIKFSFKKSNKCFMIKTDRLNTEDAERWIAFFGTDTEKGKKLYQMTHGFLKKPTTTEEALKSLNEFCKISNSSKITIECILNLIRKNQKVNKKMLVNELRVGTSTLYKYLWLLEKANIIKAVKTTGGPGLDNWYSYNNEIDKWTVPD